MRRATFETFESQVSTYGYRGIACLLRSNHYREKKYHARTTQDKPRWQERASEQPVRRQRSSHRLGRQTKRIRFKASNDRSPPAPDNLASRLALRSKVETRMQVPHEPIAPRGSKLLLATACLMHHLWCCCPGSSHLRESHCQRRCLLVSQRCVGLFCFFIF